LNEFDIIRNYFACHSQKRDEVVLGIGDDAAITRVGADLEQVITTDTLVAGIHFPVDTHPAEIGHKALAVNLSDIAAMGAEPVWFTMNICLPGYDKDWLDQFTSGLFSLADKYKICLIGGDTVRSELVISILVAGQLPRGSALKRSGARKGDKVFVSGYLGDAAMAYACKQGQLVVTETDLSYLLNTLNKPEPRVELGQRLRGIANSAIDISDGLLADLDHVLKESNCGATIDLQKIPSSPVFSKYKDQLEDPVSAVRFGDDYELCFTVPDNLLEQVRMLETELGIPLTMIGEIETAPGLRMLGASGFHDTDSKRGYDHFSDT